MLYDLGNNIHQMSAPIIDITDLSKFYGKARGIEHINLEIDEGEIFGFIGPNVPANPQQSGY